MLPMETSSESDSFDGSKVHRCRGIDTRRRSSRGMMKSNAGIADKIYALANTLQDTSNNLNKVDQMLDQYREHTDEYADAKATLQESLREPVHQLQTQRLKRSTGLCSPSLSTLRTSSLEDDIACGGLSHKNPTSSLKDYASLEMSNRRKSRSSTVRFRDPAQTEEQAPQIHSLHQAFRDLCSDQLQLGHELDQEILKRNRTDSETRKTFKDLTGQMHKSHLENVVSLRVERRLRKIENEMHSEPQVISKGHSHLQNASISDGLYEALKRCDAQIHNSQDDYRNRLLRSESEKCKLDQELERARQQLDNAEGGRGALLQQTENMQKLLLRSEREHTRLQREISLLLQRMGLINLQETEPSSLGLSQGDKHKENDTSMQFGQNDDSETEELRRTVERKEKEKRQLAFQIEALSLDLERKGQQQIKMLNEIQAFSEDRGGEQLKIKAQLTKNETMRKELRIKAQDAIRQWKAKCKKLERQLQELKERQDMDITAQALTERETILSQQVEATCRQLAEILAHLAQREEEVRQSNISLSEARSQLLILKQELRESKDSLRGLEDEAHRQSLLQTHLREEKQKLEDQLEDVGHQREREQGNLLELQSSVKGLNAERVKLTEQLAEAESLRRELEKRLAMAQEEKTSLSQQLQLEREIHQKELDHLRISQPEGKTRQNRNLQKTVVGPYYQEREELKGLIKHLNTEGVVDKKMVRVLEQKLEKLKIECDKLTEHLNISGENHAKLHMKCQMLKEDLNEKTQFAKHAEEKKQRAEDFMTELQKKMFNLQREHDSILHSVGSQIDLVCRALFKDSAEKLKAIMVTPCLQNDPHHWLAEMKTKLQWLCDEVSVHKGQEKKLTRTVQQYRIQMKTLNQNRDTERKDLLERITELEQLFQDINSEKKDLLEKIWRKDNDLRIFKDRIADLEMSTKLALDHLESVPEKLNLLENFKDLEASHRQREMVEERYAKYKEIVAELQHHLEESKRRIQEYKDENLDVASQSLHLDGMCSSLCSQSKFLTN